MNNADLIVEWCSVTKQGTRHQFKRSCEDLLSDTNPSKVLGALETMGFVEVDWDGSGAWSVNPPALALLDGSGGQACLIGARTSGTWESLSRLKESGQVESLTQVTNPTPYPSTWFVGVTSRLQLEECAAEIGATAVWDPAGSYLNHFVGLDQILTLARREFAPSGFEARKFNPESLRFEPTDVQHARWPAGCFEQLSNGRNVYLFVDDEGCRHVTDRWVAIHAEIRRVRRLGHRVPEILRWNTDRRLACPASAQLPAQWARAAVFSSGLPPKRFTSPMWVDVYSGVRATIYKRLCDELEVEPANSDLSNLRDEVTG